MSTTEIEKIVHRLTPEFLEELKAYLLDLVKRQERVAGKKQPDERLKSALKFKGDAPFPNISVSKADYYEQYLS